MADAPPLSTESDNPELDDFFERMLQSFLGTFNIFSMYLGHRNGLYETMAGNGGFTSAELAGRTETHERYIREWLEHQTVSGILKVENASAGPMERRYYLPPAQAEVLAEHDSPNYLGSLVRHIVGVTHPVELLAEKFRTGEGISFTEYGRDNREGQSGANRVILLHTFPNEYLPAMPEIHERLKTGSPARVCDLGCGTGWSSIGIAKAYPNVEVVGYDTDLPSIQLARTRALEHGVADRISFHVRDASDPSLGGAFDLVTAFDCMHDMANPVGVLQNAHRMTHGKGPMIVMEVRVGDAFSPDCGDDERIMYGFAVLLCVANELAEHPSAATGGLLRPPVLRQWAEQAGFQAPEILPFKDPLYQFYRVHG